MEGSERKKAVRSIAVLEAVAEDVVLARTPLTEAQKERLVAAISLFKGVPLNHQHTTLSAVLAEAKKRQAEAAGLEPKATTPSSQVMKQRS